MNKLKISLLINIIIVIFVIIATFCMLNGIQFMVKEDALTATKIEAFKYFTVDSNILMGIASFLFSVYEIALLKGKISEIPLGAYVFKLTATVGVILTFVITAFFLAPTALNGFLSLYLNSNLFYHFVIPLFSFITFIFFESGSNIDFKYSFVGLIPMFIYAIIYTFNCITHIENGKVSYKYDWYGFLLNGVDSIALVFSIILITTYIICVILWSLNRRKKRNNSSIIC